MKYKHIKLKISKSPTCLCECPFGVHDYVVEGSRFVYGCSVSRCHVCECCDYVYSKFRFELCPFLEENKGIVNKIRRVVSWMRKKIKG